LRRLLDFLLHQGVIDRKDIVVLDADDMLNDPECAIRKYCQRVGINFSPSMLSWTEKDCEYATEVFEKWKGFHEDALTSSELKKRTHRHVSHSQQELSSSYGPPPSNLVTPYRKLRRESQRTRSGGKSTARMRKRSSGAVWKRTFPTMNISSHLHSKYDKGSYVG
jgi:hypothetical protein